jgi:hypothetical protein
MKKISRNSIHSLQEEAERSGDNEAFTVLAKIGDCRIGMGARLESPRELTFFIEVLVSLCTGYDQVNLNIIERKLSLLKRLNQKGYVLECEEDGCVSCELTVQSKGLTAECMTASSILEKYMKMKNGQSIGRQSDSYQDGGDKRL